MDSNDQENLDSQETETEETVNDDTSEEEGEDERQAEIEKLRKENATLQKQKEHWREKAEKKVESKETQPEGQLSTRDLLAITSAQIHPDDVDEVLKASKVLGKSVSEALSDPIVQGILEKRTEYRKTAQASNTKTTRQSVKKPDERELQENLSKGNVPDKGSREAEELFWARRGGRR